MTTIVLISCSKKKLNHKAKAKCLYDSNLFKMSLSYAHSFQPCKIFILSAKYGLIGLEEEIEPYDETLKKKDVAARKAWTEKVHKQMSNKVDFEKDKVIVLAGRKYVEYLVPHFKNIGDPLKGMRMGERLKFLKNNQ